MALTKAHNRMIEGAMFNVLDYGADNTGASNSASSIQSAIQAAADAGGGVVEFPLGTYDIGTTSLVLKTGVVLRGLGYAAFGNDASVIAQAGATIKYTGTTFALEIGNNGTESVYGGGVENIQFFGNATGENGIRLSGPAAGSVTGLVFRDVLVNNFTDKGIELTTKCFITDFYHCNVRNCGTGFYCAEEANRTNFFGCDANYCTTGFLIGKGSGTSQYTISIFGGRVENVTDGIVIDTPTGGTLISGVYIEAFSARGIKAQNGSTPVTITGCSINGSAASGSHIYVAGGGFLDISTCHFTGSTNYEIEFGSGAVYGQVVACKFGSTVVSGRVSTPAADSNIRIEDTNAGAVTEYATTHSFNLDDANSILNIYGASATVPSFRAAYDKNYIGKTSNDTTTTGTTLYTTGAVRQVITGTSTLDAIQFYREGGGLAGTISVTASTTAYNTSSDYRLKENVVDLTGATNRIKQIPVRQFNFISEPNRTVDGFLAHEVAAIVPEAVTGEHDGVDDNGNPIYQGIDQSKLVPLLVATVKELEARIAALEP